jgi:hypothetical protein
VHARLLKLLERFAGINSLVLPGIADQQDFVSVLMRSRKWRIWAVLTRLDSSRK